MAALKKFQCIVITCLHLSTFNKFGILVLNKNSRAWQRYSIIGPMRQTFYLQYPSNVCIIALCTTHTWGFSHPRPQPVGFMVVGIYQRKSLCYTTGQPRCTKRENISYYLRDVPAEKLMNAGRNFLLELSWSCWCGAHSEDINFKEFAKWYSELKRHHFVIRWSIKYKFIVF